MNARPIRTVIVLWGLSTLGIATGSGAALAASYPIRHLDPTDALMALNVRVPGMGQDCRSTPSPARDPASAGVRGFLEITCTTDAIQMKIQAALEAVDVSAPTHRFHVAVLAASRREGPVPDVAPGEVKALNDFKKVMPYKGFQVEAETVLQSDGQAQTQLNSNYVLELVINATNGGGDSIDVRRFQLRGSNVQTVGSGSQTYYTNYIETSFSIKKGETVVLGTSVSDQQARVVLVTALP
jgi:hypothetical protein